MTAAIGIDIGVDVRVNDISSGTNVHGGFDKHARSRCEDGAGRNWEIYTSDVAPAFRPFRSRYQR